MARLLLLALLLSPGAAPPDRPAKPPRTKGEGTAADGEPCHFPFRYQRKIHHSCLWGGPHGPRPWCATTPNYDWDHKWTLCGEDKRVTDPCKPNPCENGGACTGTGGGYRCVCPAPFHGRHCQKAFAESCLEEQLLAYFPPGARWLRSRPPGVEECHCAGGKAVCRPAHGTACATNPCANGGLCVAVKREQVCSCPSGYLGPFCDTVQGQACYSGRGLLYRGMANTTLSGAQCLPWDSDLLAHEFSTRSMPHARRWGLGSHAFCRNPDNDTRPWCYMLREGQLLWEFCSVPPCEPHAGAVEAGGQAGAVPTSSSASPAQACGAGRRRARGGLSRCKRRLPPLAWGQNRSCNHRTNVTAGVTIVTIPPPPLQPARLIWNQDPGHRGIFQCHRKQKGPPTYTAVTLSRAWLWQRGEGGRRGTVPASIHLLFPTKPPDSPAFLAAAPGASGGFLGLSRLAEGEGLVRHPCRLPQALPTAMGPGAAPAST